MTKRDETKPPWEMTRDGYHRIRIRAGRSPRGKSQQIYVTIATRDEGVALTRLARLRELSARLVPQALTLEARVAIQKAAEQVSDLHFELCCSAALEMAPEVAAKAQRKTWHVFRELAAAWTSHDLHRRWPDHVGKKASWKDDKAKLDYLCELVVDDARNRKLGDMPLGDITFDHATAAMRQLPPDCRRPATRRQYAQCIGRVLKLAVFPAGIIGRSPLPPNFLPEVPEGDLLFPHFYPDEDLRLMRCATLDYAERALFGLCNREGGRLGEFLRKLKWSGIDERRGVMRLPGLQHRKNGKPGEWQAEPGSIEALLPLRQLGGEGPFTHLADDRKWSNRLHDMMREAQLDRDALFNSNVSEGFRRMRGHDTRATYITLALACGLAETHIMTRTGHTTSKMVHRYDRSAQALSASDSGSRLMPLDVALGLPLPPPRRPGWMTLDPRSAEAETLERLARVAVAVPALPAGGSGREGGGGHEVVDGVLVDDDEHHGEGGSALEPDGPGVARTRAHRGTSAPERLPIAVGGEMEPEIKSGPVGSCHELSGENGGLFDAECARQGSNLQALRRRNLNPACSPPDDPREHVTTRTLVAGSPGKPHDVSPDQGQVRCENRVGEAPLEPIEVAPREPVDAVLVALRTAAHAAVDRGDAGAVADLMAAIERHRSGVGRTGTGPA